MKSYRYLLSMLNNEKPEVIIKAEDDLARDAFFLAFLNMHNGILYFKDDKSDKNYLKRHILSFQLLGED